MVKIFKYSQKNLLKYIKLLVPKVYIFFYDLDIQNFDDTILRLSNGIDNIEAKTIKVRNESYLLIFSYINFEQLKSLVVELNSMDISEFYIAEYRESKNDQKISNSAYLDINTENIFCKTIYVNKDEATIQLYNFS